MIRKKSEDAVSPVIGVMLLLVVTIVIAAVVAAFAGGIGIDTQPVPSTALEIIDVKYGVTEETFTYDVTQAGLEEDFVEEEGVGFTLTYKVPGTGETVAVLKMNYETGAEEWTYTTDQNLIDTYVTKISNGMQEKYSPTVTLSSLHGDTLDLSKISVKVRHTYPSTQGAGEIEVQQNTLSGSLMPGDRVVVPLSGNKVNAQLTLRKNSAVDVVVYYGNHIIAESENMRITAGA